MNDNRIYASLENNGLKLVDEELVEKYDNKKISASLVTGMFDCPAKWAANTPLQNFLEIDLDNAMTRGSLFHRVMEHFFMLPKEERNKKNCYGLVKKTLEEKDFLHFKDNKEAKFWLKIAIDNYFDMGAKPENVEVSTFKNKSGLELMLIGNIPGVEREFIGFIDRLSEKDGRYIIEDWKTGGKAKKYDINNKYEEGWPEARQQILYSVILNKENRKNKETNQYEDIKPVKNARLIFPVAKEVININTRDKTLVRKAVNDTIKAEEIYNDSQEKNLFEYKPSFLCHWCPLAKVCPAAKPPVKSVEKAINAYNSQPDKKELQKGLYLK